MRFSAIIHLLLLGYIVAALGFWWISLEKQSTIIYAKEMTSLSAQLGHSISAADYADARDEIELRKQKRSKQYLGEGLTFLAVILVGSFIVYTSYRMNSKLQQQQNNFMLSVTHELKSPIAAMKLTLQTMQRRRLPEDKQAELISKCILEADRLNELCSNILIASQMEGGVYHQEMSLLSATTTVAECVASYQDRYPHKFFLHAASSPLYVFSDSMLLQLVLNNLLENAVKYTQPEQSVEVCVSGKDERLFIAVKDTGSGIPDGEKKKVFDKFYRIGDENTRKAKGTGLGLYLSKKIVHHLGGEIVLTDNKPRGSVFTIILPLAKGDKTA